MVLKQARLYTLEIGDEFRIAGDPIWYRVLTGYDDVGCIRCESVNEDYYDEFPGSYLVMVKI